MVQIIIHMFRPSSRESIVVKDIDDAYGLLLIPQIFL